MNSITSSNLHAGGQSAAAVTASPSAQSSSGRKLPYQATHQVELIHLEAETEALLQQLQALKQRRQAIENTLQPAEQPVLAVR